MTLALYIGIISLFSIAVFWLVGSIFGLIHRPAIYFPLSLATKMAVSSVLGVFFFGVGGVILATLIFNIEMKKRQDYQAWLSIFFGLMISITGSIAIYFLIISLAWEIFQ